MEPEQLRSGLDEVFSELRTTSEAPKLAQLLRSACHDMNNALGTLALEAYSIGAIIGEKSSSLPPATVDEFSAALANAEAAREVCERLVEAMHVAARSLDPVP